MIRPQFSLKTFLWLMALVAAFYAGTHRERRLLEAERKRLTDWSYDLDVQQNRFRKESPVAHETFIDKDEARRKYPDAFDSDGNFRGTGIPPN